MSQAYSGRQFVAMDLHRRGSVLVWMTESGEHLEAVRILNNRDRLAHLMSRAGQSPEVVLEADALAELGATVYPPTLLRPGSRKVRNVSRTRRCGQNAVACQGDGTTVLP